MESIRGSAGRSFYVGLLEALIEVMGTAKGYLFSHGARVALLSQAIGKEMGLPQAEQAELLFSAVLSDLGMIGLAEDAWVNPVLVLPDEARERVKGHPERSEATVAGIPYLESIAPLVRHHHEWWDGGGYPDGLAGEQIPVGARILRLADTVAALGEPRPQRPAIDADTIRQIVEGAIGTEFDAEVVKVYFALEDSERVPDFHHTTFYRASIEATADLIPEQISALSGREFLEIMGSLIDAKDPYTAGHSHRVATLGTLLCEVLGVGETLAETVWSGGFLHDLGKISVPLAVLSKTGRLNEEERRSIEQHAATGAEILAAIPGLRHLSPACRYHHERWDGSGYPEGLSGSRIPLVARILGVCDAYDAMTSNRSYRPARTHAEAVQEIASETGGHFGPVVALAFLEISKDQFTEVRARSEAPGTEPPSRRSVRTRFAAGPR
ncbi:MAG: HD domain-containing protein [Gemmatimonadetes bacterium]|nr:HD domain-containing protein [Gemmatimonadota bacterium]